MLRESGELDQLIPDLLLNMDITPFTRAQKGPPREFGVDVAARGVDPEDGLEKLFLFVIKPGNLTRSDWYSTPQSVKPTLDEVINIYLTKKLRKKDNEIKKKIILCCGGDMKRELHEDWNAFIENHENKNLEIDFWGGDELSTLIEQYFLDEYLFPESARKQIRKTLALLGDSDYDLSDYYAFLKSTFDYLLHLKTKLTQKKVKVALRQINLSLRIVFHWSKEEESLKQAYLASERALLLTYNFLIQKELFQKKALTEAFFKIYYTHQNISIAYFSSIENHLYVRDSFFGYGADKYDYPLRTFEVIGTISSIGIDFINMSILRQDPEYFQYANRIAEGLASLIKNNSSSNTPLFDRNAIEIGLALSLLRQTNREKHAIDWIESIMANIILGYQFNQYFPIYTDLYDDLIPIEEDPDNLKDEYTSISTIVPMLFQWLIIFDRKDLYKILRERYLKFYSHTDLQLWFPDKDSEEFFYKTNAAYHSGITFHSIQLYEDFNDFIEMTKKMVEWDQTFTIISCFQKFPSISVIASRHYKIPLPPITWYQFLPDLKPNSDLTGFIFD